MVPHTILTIPLELDAGRRDQAETLIRDAFLKPQEASHYADIAEALPELHFMSVVIFDSGGLDPLMTLELNFDGAPDAFLRRFEACYGEALRDLLRLAKRPRDATGALHDAVTAPGATAPVARYLAAKAVRPVTPYRGARGFSRARILAEATLYDAAQDVLGDGMAFRGKSPGEVHAALRGAGTIAPLLDGEAPDPAPWRAQPRDWLRLVGVLAALVVSLGLPGLVLAWAISPAVVAAILVALAGVAVLNWQELRAHFLPTLGGRFGTGGIRLLALAAGALALVAAALAILHAAGMPAPRAAATWGGGFVAAWAAFLLWLVSGLLAALLAALAILALLRRREHADPVHAPAVMDDRTRRAVETMAEREDKIAQNHMGSHLIVKPGGLRAFLLWTSHGLLSSLARTVFAEGFLGPMRTIHFAHWCILDSGSRLVFFSNFDGSWDSYLSDFTEKASGGVNLAWANCIGFPPSTFILEGGSRNGRLFKGYARHSMAPTLFWFSAYRDLSVGEIHRNARVAAGLRRRSMPTDEAAAWARDL